MKKEKKKRVKIHEITAENDMKYRGPLNLSHFKISGWICVVIGQAGFLMSFFSTVFKITDKAYTNTAAVFTFIGSFALLFLLIANFALILNSKEKYLQVILKYAALTLSVAVLFYYLYDHIIDGVFKTVIPEYSLAEFIVMALITSIIVNFYNEVRDDKKDKAVEKCETETTKTEKAEETEKTEETEKENAEK